MQLNYYSLARGICRESYFEFFKMFWPVISPEPLVLNWHVEYLCNEIQHHMERVFKRQTKECDLIVNISPGTSKSSIFSVLLQPWCWTRMPGLRKIGCSYQEELAFELTVKSRRVVQSPLYSRLFPEIELRKDLNAKSLWSNTLGGDRYAIGMGGGIMGKHGHLIVLDDPLNPREGRSEAAINTAREFCTESLPSRLIHTENDASFMMLVMQRICIDDPTGLWLQRSGVKQICLPAELTDDVKPENLRDNYVDGLFSPTLLPRAKLGKKLEELGQYGYSGQFLQSPIPLGGGMFKVDKLEEHYAYPGDECFTRIARFWDKACFLPHTRVTTRTGQKAIKSVKVGEKVLTRDGWKPVYFSGCTKTTKELCSVVFSDGTWNTSTPDHLYLTDKGNWITIASIGDGDSLTYIGDNTWADQSTQIEKQLSSTVSGTQGKKVDGTTTTMLRTRIQKSNIAVHSTETSGSSYTVKRYPVAIMCTTLTATGITIIQKILNAFPEPSTGASTESRCKKCKTELPLLFRKIEKEHLRAYAGGKKIKKLTTQRLTEKQRDYAAKPRKRRLGKTTQMVSLGFAVNVTKSTNPTLEVLKPNSAQTLVNKHLTHQNQREKTGVYSAKTAGQNFPGIVVKNIVLHNAARLVGAKVYDISVKDNPEFYANGVLVHNCSDGKGDWTVGVKMGLHKDGTYWILDVARGQWSTDVREKIIQDTAARDGKRIRIGFEQEPGSSGIDSAKESIKRLSGYLVEGFRATGSKEVRADTFSVQVNAGNVKVLKGKWLSDYKYELAHFPNAKHDDQVDASSGAFSMLINKKVKLGVLR